MYPQQDQHQPLASIHRAIDDTIASHFASSQVAVPRTRGDERPTYEWARATRFPGPARCAIAAAMLKHATISNAPVQALIARSPIASLEASALPGDTAKQDLITATTFPVPSSPPSSSFRAAAP